MTRRKRNDDQEVKAQKRSTSKIGRMMAALDNQDVPERSCAHCRWWTPTEETWGECEHTVVVKERIPPTVYEGGMEPGTIMARWPDPHGRMICEDAGWRHALAFGKAQRLRTHRTFVACDRFTDEATIIPFPRLGPSLLERVRRQG